MPETRGKRKGVVEQPPGTPPPAKGTPPPGSIPKKKPKTVVDTNIARKKLTLKSINEDFISMKSGLAAVVGRLDVLLGADHPPGRNQDEAEGSGSAGPTTSTGSASKVVRSEEENRRREAMSAYPHPNDSRQSVRKRPASSAAGGPEDRQQLQPADVSRPRTVDHGSGFDSGVDLNIQRRAQDSGAGAWPERSRERYPPAPRRVVDPFRVSWLYTAPYSSYWR